MSDFLRQIISATGNGSGVDTFWMQILVFSLFVASWGIFTLVKNKKGGFKKEKQIITGAAAEYITKCKELSHKYALNATQRKFHIPESPKEPEPVPAIQTLTLTAQKKPENQLAGKKDKDLYGGMELLELDFLLTVIENTKSDNKDDVTMRKLNFYELLRRKKLSHVNSNTLKIYAINQKNLYGKEIQYQALKQLTERTSSHALTT